MTEILVTYYSCYGATEKMAELIARGINSVDGMQARVRSVAPLTPPQLENHQIVPKAPVVTPDDFKACAGLALGSPTRFGNMAAPMKACIDQLGAIWMSGATIGKPAAVFTSTASMHGGQESTLLSMMLPLFHLGYVLVGVPYSETALVQTTSGGTPYGPTHVAGEGAENRPISDEEKKLCIASGKRLAEIAKKLL